MGLAELTKKLRKQGHRITPVKKATLQYMSTAGNPFSAYDLLDHLHSRNFKINKTTAYRQLDAFVEAEILSIVNFNDGIMRYERKRDSCHHHILCTNCGRIAHVELRNVMDALHDILSHESGFKIEEHALEFFGKCDICAAKEKSATAA